MTYETESQKGMIPDLVKEKLVYYGFAIEEE